MTKGRGKSGPLRVLMTLDAVGGVWRYAMDLAAGLRAQAVETIFAGFGPPPSDGQRCEAETIGRLFWQDAPLDWMVDGKSEFESVPGLIRDLARREDVDLLHLNLPSQAAGLDIDLPVVVVSHSCVVTWFRAVRGSAVPEPWAWQLPLNAQGFKRADAVLAPSGSHANLLREVYGRIDGLEVVHNASQVGPVTREKESFVFAAGRWWDDGKNGAILDAAAEHALWPVVMAGPNRGPNGQFLALKNSDHRGELSYVDAMDLMGRAAIVVSPSLYEPFGLAALEAARGGSALVLSDIPTYRELWGGAALFADPHDAETFANAINRLADDADLRRTLAAKAQTRSQDFTTEAQSATVMRIYERLLSPAHALNAAE